MFDVCDEQHHNTCRLTPKKSSINTIIIIRNPFVLASSILAIHQHILLLLTPKIINVLINISWYLPKYHKWSSMIYMEFYGFNFEQYTINRICLALISVPWIVRFVGWGLGSAIVSVILGVLIFILSLMDTHSLLINT